MVELLIGTYIPIIQDGISIDWEMKGSPGRLNFNVINDGNISFHEGDTVQLKVDGVNLFYGYVFTKSRDKNKIISVTAYDQLRYLKNKDTYTYFNKTAADVIKMIAGDFKIKLGTIDKTDFVIFERIESNATLFDVILSALNLTTQNTGKRFVLYDDFGSICLKNVENMKLDLIIDQQTGQNFSYTSSIDSGTYNVVKLSYKDGKNEKIAVAPPSQNGLTAEQKKWGILQLFETTSGEINSAQAQIQANSMLAEYNRKTRNLTVQTFGDIRVRAGCQVIVDLVLGDLVVSNYMLVEKVRHNFNAGLHSMDLTLTGGEFIA